jgi:hypothetical protein
MQTLPRSAEPLAPGRYVEPGFTPPLSFEIRDGTWVARQFVDGFFDIQQEPDTLDVIAVQFCRPTAVHRSADDAVAIGSTADALAALRANPDLAVSPTESVTIAGRPAVGVDIDTTTPRDSDPPVFSPVLRVAAGPISLASARRLRLCWLDLEDGPLVVLVGGSTAAWDRTLEAAGPIVASVRLESPAPG